MNRKTNISISKKIYDAIFGLVKKLHRLFFIIEFGEKKSKPVDKIVHTQEPQYIPWQEHRQSSWQPSPAEHRPYSQELPQGYNEDRIVLQVRDPWWLHSYWEITQGTKDSLKNSLGDSYYQADWMLRVYDVSFIVFNGSNAHRYFDIGVGPNADNWYINVYSGCSFCVDLGLKLKDGTFITIMRSNTVTTPLDGPSWILDEEWMILDDDFMKLYGVGFGGTSPGARRRMRKLKEFVSSFGFLSRINKEK
ncbi:MAG: DUF4912 domain-containing protein [Candidatus Omnitrophica bacterium]|nr:DUF4912 domain-containing protein [Candidatus Omnitrophota bacterium]